MARGGARSGAGRKPGAATRKTREIADRAAAEGITPLEVMLAIMRQAMQQQDSDKALDAAAKAAPYCHARLAQVDQHNTGDQTVTVLVDTGVRRE